MKKYIILLPVSCLLLLAAINSTADTIYLHDGKEIKGIVVEDYHDRLVFSTPDGEITVMKRDIRELYYDSEEDNLIRLGEQARERKDYARAFGYYDMAYKKNPNSKAAKDGLVFLQGYMFRKEEIAKEADIKRREEYERYGTIVPTIKSREDALAVAAAKLKDTIGFTLAAKDGGAEVTGLQNNSPASDAGIKMGDSLVAVWGRLTGYLPPAELMSLLLDKSSLEIKCAIERAVDVGIDRNRGALAGPNDLIGASLSMEFDGLTVSSVKDSGPSFEAGLKKGDLVVSIDGSSTRYMPLNKAIDMIRDSKEGTIKFTIRRDIIIWRKS